MYSSIYKSIYRKQWINIQKGFSTISASAIRTSVIRTPIKTSTSLSAASTASTPSTPSTASTASVASTASPLSFQYNQLAINNHMLWSIQHKRAFSSSARMQALTDQNKSSIDKAVAHSLLEIARRSNKDIQYEIGLCFEYGHSDGYNNIAINYEAAVQCYKLAAENGQAKAQLLLASSYARGIGIEKNIVEAKKWLGLAVKNGVKGKYTQETIDEIDQIISAEESFKILGDVVQSEIFGTTEMTKSKNKPTKEK